MFTYVNHQAMGDLFRPLEHQPNPMIRATQIKGLVAELSKHVTEHSARTCYELKKQDWSIGAIADELGVSQHMVRRLIRQHADETGVRNPLKRMTGMPVEIDITTLVNKEAARRQASEETSHPTT